MSNGDGLPYASNIPDGFRNGGFWHSPDRLPDRGVGFHTTSQEHLSLSVRPIREKASNNSASTTKQEE
jgi:hypothetical protein